LSSPAGCPSFVLSSFSVSSVSPTRPGRTIARLWRPSPRRLASPSAAARTSAALARPRVVSFLPMVSSPRLVRQARSALSCLCSCTRSSSAVTIPSIHSPTCRFLLLTPAVSSTRRRITRSPSSPSAPRCRMVVSPCPMLVARSPITPRDHTHPLLHLVHRRLLLRASSLLSLR